MTWFDLIGASLICVSVFMIPFLFSIIAIAKDNKPNFTYFIVSSTALSAAFAGAGILERYDWRFYPLIVFFAGLCCIFLISTKTHFTILKYK